MARRVEQHRPPSLATKEDRTLWKVSLVIALAFISAIPLARAADPTVALGFQNPELRQAEETIAFAEMELRRTQLGFSGSLGIDPSYGYTARLDDPQGEPTSEFGAEVRLGIGYLYDHAAILRGEIELVQAKRRYRDSQREGIRNALLTHVDLLRAQLSFSTERRNLEQARSGLAEAESRFEIGEISEAELAGARLGLESRQLAFDGSERNLRNVRERAASFGLEGEAEYRLLSFELPEVTVASTFEYQRAALELQREEVLALQDSVFSVVEEVRVRASYEGPDYTISAGINLVNGNPGAGLETRYRSANRNEWGIAMSARLRLTDRTLGRSEAADRRVEGARTRLDDMVSSFIRNVRNAKEEVELTARALELSIRGRELEEARLKTTEARIAALSDQLATLRVQLLTLQQQLEPLQSQREAAADEARSALDEQVTAIQSEIGNTERAIETAERDLANARRDLGTVRNDRDRSEDSIYRSWSDYINRVNTYLTLTDGEWIAR